MVYYCVFNSLSFVFDHLNSDQVVSRLIYSNEILNINVLLLATSCFCFYEGLLNLPALIKWYLKYPRSWSGRRIQCVHFGVMLLFEPVLKSHVSPWGTSPIEYICFSFYQRQTVSWKSLWLCIPHVNWVHWFSSLCCIKLSVEDLSLLRMGVALLQSMRVTWDCITKLNVSHYVCVWETVGVQLLSYPHLRGMQLLMSCITLLVA